MRRKVLFDFGTWEITLREVLASLVIIAIAALIGVLISGAIRKNLSDNRAKYNKAIKINNDKDQFEYGMRTNVGNAFVYGELKAVDTVSWEHLKGKYMAITRVQEHYTMHTRQVYHSDGKNGGYYTTEVYYTWDEIDRQYKGCKEITFCGVKFSANKIIFPSSYDKDTYRIDTDDRYIFYVVDKKYTGTIFTSLRDKTISDKSRFYVMNIQETYDYLTSNAPLYIFIVMWIILSGIGIGIFYYLDNDWLE